MERSWLSNSLNKIFIRLNSVFFKIMAMMVMVTFIIFMLVPFILEELKDATTEIVIDSLSKEQEYLFEEIYKNTKESINISAQPYLLKQDSISTREQIEDWEGLLLGIGNSLNWQYGLLRIITFDLSGSIIHDYAIDDSIPRFDPQQDAINKIITQCLQEESSSEKIVTSLKNSPYWGLCLLSEDNDEEVANAHLFILDYKKILTKMKETTDMHIAIQIGNSIIHDNLGKKFIDGIIKNEKTLLVTDSEVHEHQYIIAKSVLNNGHIFPMGRESNSLIYFIHSDEIHDAFQRITSELKYIILLTFVLFSLILLATIHYILSPMKGVAKVAHAISNGDYNVRLNHKSRDEVGTVMNTINNMLDKIKENFITIKNEKENAEIKEVRLNSVVETANDAIISMNSKGEVYSWNKGAEMMFGYPAESIIGECITSLLPEKTRNAHVKVAKKYLSSHRSSILHETILLVGLRKDGSEFPAELSVSMWKAGDESYFTSVIRDITERRNAEKALEKSQSTIMQQEKMASVGQLAGGIAHDFNNILSVITGYSELVLKDMEEDTPLKEHISTIHAAGEKAANLTKELLAFSRKQPLEMKPSNMNATIDNMENILTRLIGENIRLNIIKNKDLSNVLGDKTQMEQVLMNLVVNARDAMPDGGDLTIKTFNLQFKKAFNIGKENVEPGSYSVLSVRDTGKGMSEKVQKSIFEPFFSTKEVGKGTGMGLATVYGVIKQHSGHITVHSTIGKGTVFKIYIPATDMEVEVDTVIHTNDLTGNETILAVDDEPLIVGLVIEMLEPLGYRILAASNGDEALKVCNDFTGRIDLLLTDVIMPGMNGRELAGKFIRKRPETKIIYMSGYTDDAIAHHGVLEEGVVLLNKPLKSSVVASKIREMLGPKQQQSADEILHGINILLVDDNAHIRRLIQVYMKDYECTIDTAENGKIAVDKYKLGRYDLVLMDMQMPVMDGLTATKEIRKWEGESGLSQTKIIALTGNAAQDEIDKCLKAGYSSHLPKPLKKDVLVNAIVSNVTATQSDLPSDEEVQEEQKEERYVAHVDSELQEFIPEILEETQSDIKRIEEAIKVQDYDTVRILGHTLKGFGGGYGLDTITECGEHIEDAAKEEDREEIEKWNNKLSDYIERVKIIPE